MRSKSAHPIPTPCRAPSRAGEKALSRAPGWHAEMLRTSCSAYEDSKSHPTFPFRHYVRCTSVDQPVQPSRYVELAAIENNSQNGAARLFDSFLCPCRNSMMRAAGIEH